MPLTKVKSLGTENIGGGNRNLVINGAMMISQRATTASFSAEFGIGAVDGTAEPIWVVVNGIIGLLLMYVGIMKQED